MHIAMVSISVGRWMNCLGKGRRRAYITSRVVMDIAASKVSHSVGCDVDATALPVARARASSRAMEEMPQRVQKASTLYSII